MKESSTSEDIVVFDGYDSSAKDHCRLLRSPIRGLQINLDWNTPVTNQQPVFLSNPDNKSALIGFLGDALDDTGIEVVRCRADTDVMIAQTAFIEALRGKSDRLACISGTGVVWKESGANRMGMGTQWCWETNYFTWLY